jgi:FtsH-binding integral membrane protein
MHHKWREGLGAGLIAAATGALWSMIVDLVAGHPFETWIFLGTAFSRLLGPAPPNPVVAVIVFLAFVALVFMLLGRVAVAVAHRSDVEPSLLLGVSTVLTLITLALVAIATAFATSRLGREAWLQILGSPVIALWTLGLRLYQTHPSLAADLKRADDD